ncbi:UvrD-helicase domain-containing protein [Corynebacterium breve]|uniref:DNA 3'-5' helicase n=1 Tax=Corynebacterium breve TaxID=3049799 RepID=A0ABY8VI60_9CORY|nr:UvrD-helicase domain-containing protein [Corynebacterium breve]WIM68303.1 UvrD-helicase domain-containing protein [Corynebacterium breve]
MAKISPADLARALGLKFPPTEEQAEVIGAEPGPLLVVAGAGAGKTDTMASRVVWLVANGYVRPDEILGLTFTRKAAQELGRRIRDRLGILASKEESFLRDLDPTGELAKNLEVITPTVSTYDSYAGDLVREYGLLVPVEPDARIITAAELNSIAYDVVTNYKGSLRADNSIGTVTSNLLKLMNEMGNSLIDVERIREDAHAFVATTDDLPKGPRQRSEMTKPLQKWRNVQELRTEYLPLVDELKKELRNRGVVTFNEQMSVAAQLAQTHAVVGASQRRRFRVVMLDEYQDTSHAQRVLLRSLFGENRGAHDVDDHPLTVTAVGDPMQAIYGWRGATAENLQAFVDDFPQPDGTPAPKKQLLVSWRNPPEVLALANRVSEAVLGTNENTRAVKSLTHNPYKETGDVKLGFFPSEDEEIAYVADRLAEKYRSFADSEDIKEVFSAAILVRKNRHSLEFAEALEERGVPYEVVGLAGLLDVPEVADVVAIATMMSRPQDSQAALRILAGPHCGLGVHDIKALASRARNLAGEQTPEESLEQPEHLDPMDKLRAQLDALVAQGVQSAAHAEQLSGLTDAVADLGEEDRYSEKGLRRLKRLAARLRYLRTYSLGKRLPDLFADIISVFGIRTEVLARQSAAGTIHLDRFADEVAKYPGASLDGLLDFFALAKEHEDGLDPGNVTVTANCVQILTAHKAKGLEWGTVAVVHADASTYDAQAETFLTQVQRLPDEEFTAVAEADDKAEFEALGKEYLKEVRANNQEEATRLFYVAITRAEDDLIVTGGQKVSRNKFVGPYEHFESIKKLVPDEDIVAWAHADGDAENQKAEKPAPVVEIGKWPQVFVDKQAEAAAADVASALQNLPGAQEGELFGLWERDTTSLIDEHQALSQADVAVEMPGELTASDVVSIQADPEQFARRARRPVPFKPNAYAKRGTAFHEWLEDFFGERPLLDENELPGNDESDVDGAILAELKASFEKSHWARKTPQFIEHPFEIAIGNSVVRGRMDAVFYEDDAWWVVDWKTGQKPQGRDMDTAKIQLAVYREAWQRIVNDDKDVHTVFYYVRSGEDFAPDHLPDRVELEDLLEFSSEDRKKGQ